MTKKAQKTKNVGVLVVSHANFGHHLIAAAETIAGPRSFCRAVSIDTSIQMDELVDVLRKAVLSVEEGAGVLILTDMFGGTPTNVSLSLLGSHKIEVITGVNLPMLLRVFRQDGIPLAVLAEKVKNAGTQGIVVAGELLRKKVGGD